MSVAALTLATSAAASRPQTLLILLIAQALAWAGVPALGAAAMAAAGALAGDGELQLWSVLVVGTLGAELGSLAGWWIGHRLAQTAREREGRFATRRRQALSGGERMRERWGRLVVFFVPSWVAGALGMPFREFALWNFLAALLWNIGAGLSAYGIGSALSGGSLLRSLLPILLATAALGGVATIFVRRRRRPGPSPSAPR